MRRISGPGALLLSAVLISVSSSAFAAPSTPAIEAKKALAAEARKTMQDLNDTFEMKVEEYDAAAEALEVTRGRIVVTRARLEEAERRLAEAQRRLGDRALAIYTGGGLDPITLLAGTSSFEDLVTRIDLLDRIARSDASLVAEVKGYRARVASTEASLENREAEQVALRQEADARKAEVETALRAQTAYVSGLDSQVAALVKAEEDRLRRVAEEMAKRAAEEAKRTAASRTGGGALGQGHPEAVTVALRYLGVPYVWGGSSPSGFDCSGLTSFVYRQIGIDIPRTSRAQFTTGAFIEARRTDLLLPGDLVFFGYGGDPGRVHHVGIYVGSGNYIHAPGTGDHVRVSSLTDRIQTRGDYVGATRP